MTMNRGTNLDFADSRWSWLYNISGVAALIAGVFLLIAMLGLIAAFFGPGTGNGWLSRFQDNWLVVIFKLHAEFRGIQIDRLHVLNYVDLAILALVGAIFISLYVILRSTSRIWSIVAVVQPFLGMLLFIATKTAGRSGVMGAVLVICLVMLSSSRFKKVTAYVGILASVILLTGDFSAGVIPPLTVVAILFGIGYVLMMTWFFLISQRLFQLGSGVFK